MSNIDYDKVMQFFYKCISANSLYGAIEERSGDELAEKVKFAFAVAIVAISGTMGILDGLVDPDTAYYNIYRLTIDTLGNDDSNEVVEATMKMYFPFEYDEEPHE